MEDQGIAYAKTLIIIQLLHNTIITIDLLINCGAVGGVKGRIVACCTECKVDCKRVT